VCFRSATAQVSHIRNGKYVVDQVPVDHGAIPGALKGNKKNTSRGSGDVAVCAGEYLAQTSYGIQREVFHVSRGSLSRFTMTKMTLFVHPL